MIYNFSTLGCIFRHNERQKKQNVAMLSSVALLPAKRKIAPAPLPPAVTRHPINPTTTIHMTFPEVVIEPAQPVVRKLKQSAIYRNVKLDKPEPAKTVRTYRCTLCKQPKAKEYGHSQVVRGKWYCPSYGDFVKWKKQNGLL